MRKVASGLVLAAVWLTSGAASAAGRVVINEIFANPAGDDAGKEWVELFNGGDTAVTIGGYKVQSMNASGPTVVATITAGVSLAPGAYYVVGGANVAAAQQTTLLNGSLLNAGGDNGAGVRLVTDTNVTVDTVVYGPTANGIVDDTNAVAVSFAPVPVTYASLSRIPNGSDTQASGTDFKNVELTLGAANADFLPPFDGGVGDGGTGGSTDGGDEDAGTSSSGGASSGGGSSSGATTSSSSGAVSSSSGGKSSSSGGKSSSSGGKSSSSGGKADAGKTSSSGTSSGDDDADADAAATDDGGCNTGPGGSLPVTAVIGTGVLALLMRRRRKG